jgi:NAD(P)-dependent dehydrogenase (short-subunit alcohol dehydrogenase family)
VADVDADGGQATVDLVEAGGGTAQFIETDIAVEAQVDAMVGATVRSFGRLDFAHNNAAIEGMGAIPTHQCSADHWRRLIEVNLVGTWLCMKAEIGQMLVQGAGAIVNTASVAGLVASPSGSAYTASKHGVIGLTRSAGLEYARRGIRINAVCPGATDTPMIAGHLSRNPELAAQLIAEAPAGRLGTAEEIAAAVVWLCSDDSSFVVGHPLVVDGGYVAR